MCRKFNIGDRVICKDSGVIGIVLRFYVPTSCPEQTLVKTDDGREYHAPTNTWNKCGINVKPKLLGSDEDYDDVQQVCINLSNFIDYANYNNLVGRV